MSNRSANIIFFILISVMATHSQNYLHCLAANADADILLQWETPVSSSDFNTYVIYHSNGSMGGIYSAIATLTNYNTSSYLHAGANADSESQFYFIETNLNSGGSIISDTLKSMHLSINTGVGDVELNWTVPRTPPLSSWDDEYQIWMEYPLNNWTQIGSSITTNYFYEIQVCDDSLSFRIDLNDNFGCKSVSNYNGGVYQDITKPPMPVIDSVSVDQAIGKAIVGWEVNPATDTKAYIIYKYINTSWIIIDTVDGRFNTSYTDPNSSPCSIIESYALAAFDSCGNKSLGTFLIPQQTISLSSVDYNACIPSHTLNWTEYINMEPGIDGYEIYLSTNGSVYQPIGQTSSGTRTYINTNIQYGNQYSYFIRAFNNSNEKTSSSCIKSHYARQYHLPQFNYVANVTVINNQFIQISSYLDNSVSINKVILRRSSGQSGNFVEIDSTSGITGNMIIFDDLSVDINTTSYEYDIILKDSCSYNKESSNTINSVLLRAQMLDASNIKLTWNEIFGWDGMLEEYILYRKVNNQSNVDIVAALGPTDHEYTDDISSLNLQGETFTYFLEAKEGPGNIYGFQESSLSNEASIKEDATLFFPNAFKPSGINNIFKPVGIFVNQRNYLLQIYNRWGELLFESKLFQNGWSGQKNGKNLPSGVYMYIVSYSDSDGKNFQHKGSFVLIR